MYFGEYLQVFTLELLQRHLSKLLQGFLTPEKKILKKYLRYFPPGIPLRIISGISLEFLEFSPVIFFRSSSRCYSRDCYISSVQGFSDFFQGFFHIFDDLSGISTRILAGTTPYYFAIYFLAFL